MQGRATAIMQVRGRVLDAPERKGLDRPFRTTDVEALHLQVMHVIVHEGGTRVADGALGLAVEQALAAEFGGGRLLRNQLHERSELRSGREVNDGIEVAHAV